MSQGLSGALRREGVNSRAESCPHKRARQQRLRSAIVSGANAPPAQEPLSQVSAGTVQELDRWEERLEELFAGRPYDIYDAALTATISDFPVSIQPFRDMVGHGCLARPSPLHDIARASAAISGRHSRRSFSTSGSVTTCLGRCD